MSRRNFIDKTIGAVKRLQTRYTIIDAPYNPAHGMVGLPWGSAEEISDGVWDPTFDKYDALDQEINGLRARSIYWKSTKDWLKPLYKANFEKDGPSSGSCQDSAASSWFGPVIGGPITILGIDFEEDERLKTEALSFGGLYRAREFPSVLPYLKDITEEHQSDSCVLVNRTFGTDWWGVVTDIDRDLLTISRPTQGGEKGVQLEPRKASTLHNVAIIKTTDLTHPNRGGNRAVVDGDVGGLIIGTRWLVIP
jgi:hypothetical protein